MSSFDDCDSALPEDEQPASLRTTDDHGLAGLVGHQRKAGETVLSVVRNKGHGMTLDDLVAPRVAPRLG